MYYKYPLSLIFTFSFILLYSVYSFAEESESVYSFDKQQLTIPVLRIAEQYYRIHLKLTDSETLQLSYQDAEIITTPDLTTFIPTLQDTQVFLPVVNINEQRFSLNLALIPESNPVRLQITAIENIDVAVMRTNFGEIRLRLFPDKAPITVANFIRYVNEGFYNNTLFHRIIAGFMIQGGGFDTNFTQKETHEAIINEADNGLSNIAGTIAMARTTAPHSATSQFFINAVDNTNLDYQSPNQYGYAVFGAVYEGMNVVKVIEQVSTGTLTINGVPTYPDWPENPVIIQSITILN